MTEITPCLWFDEEALEAAEHYVSIFGDAEILDVSRYGEAGPRPAGTVLMVVFRLGGRRFMALNGGPQYSFTEAISLAIDCDGQDEVDRLWAALTDGGEEGPCGWCKDRYGLSWQVVPGRLKELLADPDRGRAGRAMQAMLKMRKIEISELEAAADGVGVA